ncbi:MAG: hypothetical protein AAB505_00170 [Patescibacteria group bacterium]
MVSQHDYLRSTPRERAWSWRLICLCLALLVTSVGGAVFFLNQERFALREIVITGNRLIPTTDLVSAVKKTLSRDHWLLRTDRFWFYSPLTVARELSNNFDRLMAVAVSASTFNTLRVQVVERQPTAIWCRETCFYLDETGTVFASAPDFSHAPVPVITGEWSPRPVNATTTPVQAVGLGTQPIPRSDFGRLRSLVSKLNQFLATTVLAGQTIWRIDVSTVGDYEFYSEPREPDQSGFKIISTRRQTETEIISLLHSTLTVATFKNELAIGRALTSLDLRFPGKIFYRFD